MGQLRSESDVGVDVPISHDDTRDDSLSKFEWERQYFHSHNEPGHSLAFPVILIGGPIIATLVIWLFVLPR